MTHARILLPLLLVLVPVELFAQSFTLKQFPAPLQFYPRDKQDSARVPVSGSVATAGYDSAILVVKKNGADFKRLSAPLSYGGGSAQFSFTAAIHAELSEYAFFLSVKNGSVNPLLASRDSIVCGDAYLINGQSNSWPANGLASYVSEYCRGFGRSTGYDPYDPADTSWGLSRATGAFNYLAHAGVWGLRLAQSIKETYHVPVCFLNGGSGGSSIEYNLPNEGNLQDLNTTYGRLLYRAVKAGIADKVRAILWHQGESNTDGTWVNYAANFQTLYNAWHRDFPGIEKVYLFQIHQGCGGEFQDNLRDLQRRFPDAYADMEIMSTAGIPGHDGCHYDYGGYNQMAGQLFRQLARDLYGSVDTVDINPPAIARAFYTSPASREIALVFSRTQTLHWPADTLGWSMRDYFYLDGLSGAVVSGAASHDTLYLQLASASAAQTIQYLPNIYYNGTSSVYEGPWVRNGRGIGALSFSGVRILSPPDGPPDLLFPLQNALNHPVQVQFRWSSVRNGKWYRHQLATDSLFSQLVAEKMFIADTALAIGNLSNATTFYWRVRAGNEVMESAWSAARKFTTVVRAPETPMLSSPADGAADQPLSVSLQWSPAERADDYRIQVARDSGFQSPVYDQGVPSISALFSGAAYHTTYFWRVRSRNIGGASSWSTVWTFTTSAEPPPSCLLELPVNHAAGIGRGPTLQWHPAPRASRYRLQVGPDSLFASPALDDSTLTDTSRALPPLAFSRLYYWRVRAFNAGGTAPWSERWDFETIMETPAEILLLMPPDASTRQLTTVQFLWRSSARAARFQFQAARDTLFVSPEIDVVTSDTTFVGGSLAFDTPYFWRVRGWNAGGYGDWSRPFRFRTIMQAPGDVALRSPADGAGDVPLPPLLRWDPSDRAESYSIQLSSDSLFSSTILSDSTVSTEFRVSGGLGNDERYYWRVRARNEAGSSGWAGPRTFTTVAAPPGIPTPLLPANGASDQPLTLTLRWIAGSAAKRHHLQLASDSAFTMILLEDSAVAFPSRAVGPLSPGSRYFWRLRALNRIGTSSWSERWDFRTQPPLPGVPVPIAPADKADRVPLPARFLWNSVPGADRYRFLISRESFFATPDIDLSLRDTTVAIDTLERARTYYWRVGAGNVSGSGALSPILSFATISLPPGAPLLLSPPDRSTLPANGIICTWQKAVGAMNHRLQLSADSLFHTSLIDDSTLPGGSYSLPLLTQNSTWFWRVRGINAAGAGSWSATWRFNTGGVSAIGGERSSVRDDLLVENHPNPFRSTTEFRFTIPEELFVSVRIYSLLGKEIAPAIDRRYSAGTHNFTWRTDGLPAGTYTVRLTAGARSVTRSIILLR